MFSQGCKMMLWCIVRVYRVNMSMFTGISNYFFNLQFINCTRKHEYLYYCNSGSRHGNNNGCRIVKNVVYVISVNKSIYFTTLCMHSNVVELCQCIYYMYPILIKKYNLQKYLFKTIPCIKIIIKHYFPRNMAYSHCSGNPFSVGNNFRRWIV